MAQRVLLALCQPSGMEYSMWGTVSCILRLYNAYCNTYVHLSMFTLIYMVSERHLCEAFWIVFSMTEMSLMGVIFWWVTMPFSSVKMVWKLAKMVKANNFPHSYRKIGVSKLHDAAFLHLPWWTKANIHRFLKKQSERNTLYVWLVWPWNSLELKWKSTVREHWSLISGKPKLIDVVYDCLSSLK